MFLPPSVASFVRDGQLERVEIGCTAARVFRITGAGQPALFLKSALVTEDADLSAEAERLDWFQSKLAVPRVLLFLVYEGWEYLITTGLPGVNGVAEATLNPEAVATRLGHALARFHAQPIDGCPFDETLRVRIERAHVRLQRGWVDESDFDEERCGMTASQAYQDLALASRSIADNLGQTWVDPFFEAYGLSTPDDQKLRFYRLLDEFF